MSQGQQFLRKWSLVVADDIGNGLDLSALRIKFEVNNSDVESPNTASIRVYNLSPDTVKQITSKNPLEYKNVVLQAGYEGTDLGIIFQGTIIQFRRGREGNMDTYLDILAASGDIEYNYTFLNQTLSKDLNTPENIIKATAKEMGLNANIVQQENLSATGGINPRGKVLWGEGKQEMRKQAATLLSSWSINNGVVQVIPLQGYLPGTAVVLNAATGLIGTPEQTDQGIRIRCLLNPKIIIGGTIKLDNATINQIFNQNSSALPVGQLAFNKYRDAVSYVADISTDGVYRVYVAEHVGDSRGNEWYTDIIALAIDESKGRVINNG